VKGDLPDPPDVVAPADAAKLGATFELSLGEIPIPDQDDPPEWSALMKGDFPPFHPGAEGMNAWTAVVCRDVFRDVLMSSGYFASVDESVERGDVHFRITTASHGSSFLAMNPGVWTAFAIVLPTWAADDRIYHVEVLQNEREPKYYDTTTTLITLAWTPLMLAAPFGERADSRNARIFHAVFRDVVARMKADGAFGHAP
jgi:hypothetical protein